MYNEDSTTLCAEKHQLFENISLSANMAELGNDFPADVQCQRRA
jgi:hypothetical protein